MKAWRGRRAVRGYLMEVPLVLMAVVVTVVVLFPRLGEVGRKVLIGVALAPVLWAVHYQVLTPGWTPGGLGAPGKVKRAAFWGFVVMVLSGYGAWVLRG